MMKRIILMLSLFSLTILSGCASSGDATSNATSSLDGEKYDLKGLEEQYVSAVFDTVEGFNQTYKGDFQVNFLETVLGTTGVADDGSQNYYETTKYSDEFLKSIDTIAFIELDLRYTGDRKEEDVVRLEDMLSEQDIFSDYEPLFILDVYQNTQETYDPLLQDYYIKDDFLWHKDEKMIEQSLVKSFWPDNLPIAVDTVELTKFLKDDKVFLFMIGGVNCGGCSYTSEHYFVIDPQDNSFEAKELSTQDTQGDPLQLFNQDQNSIATLSPDGKKLAYVVGNSSERPENIYVYDFESEKEYEVHTVRENSTVVHCPYIGCDVIDNALYWDASSRHLNIQPVDPDPYSDEEVFELYEVKINVDKL